MFYNGLDSNVFSIYIKSKSLTLIKGFPKSLYYDFFSSSPTLPNGFTRSRDSRSKADPTSTSFVSTLNLAFSPAEKANLIKVLWAVSMMIESEQNKSLFLIFHSAFHSVSCDWIIPMVQRVNLVKNVSFFTTLEKEEGG